MAGWLHKMNPLDWKPEHQIALGLAMVVGAAIGVIVGYLVYTAASGIDGFSGLWWGVFGAAIGAGIIFFGRLTSD